VAQAVWGVASGEKGVCAGMGEGGREGAVRRASMEGGGGGAVKEREEKRAGAALLADTAASPTVPSTNCNETR
jgi:hypothetical protein